MEEQDQGDECCGGDDCCEAATSSCLSPAASACQQIVDKFEALMARQQECQDSLSALAQEHKDFFRDLRAFADSGSVAPRGSGVPLHSSGARQQPAKSILRQDLKKRKRSRFASFFDVTASAGLESLPPDAATRSGTVNLGSASMASDAVSQMTVSQPLGTGRFVTILNLRNQFTSLFTRGSLYSRFTASRNTVFQTAPVMWSRAHFNMILNWRYHEAIMGLIIFLNAANIGWTIERELKNQDTHLQTVFEIIVVVIFWAELCMVFVVRGLKCFKEPWSLLDLVINLSTTLVLIVVSIPGTEESGREVAGTMKQMLILRMIRLCRLFRAVRLIKMSRSLWKLVKGLQHCMGTMISALVLMFMALFVFACFGAELITKPYAGDPEVAGLVAQHMSSIPGIMLTLFQFIAMDGTAPIYVTLAHHRPFLFLYFLLLVVFVTIMLMNLITAVIVEDAITSATMDVEMKNHCRREKLRTVKPFFQELFRLLDANSNGTVQIHEIVAVLNEGIRMPERVHELVTPQQIVDFFDLLDQDNSGELTEDEFVEGMSCLALSDVPIETLQILHLLRVTRNDVMRLHETSRATRAYLDRDRRRTLQSRGCLLPI